MIEKLNQKNINKIFVTGIFGVGKTFFAKNYSTKNNLPFIDFDKMFNYRSIDKYQARKILLNLPEKFIIDAIPISDKNPYRRWDEFEKYEKQNNCLVICLYCPDDNAWRYRLNTKRSFINLIKPLFSLNTWRKKLERGLLRLIKELPETLKMLRKRDFEDCSKEMHAFWIQALPILIKFKNIKYYDTINKEFTSEKVMRKRIQYERLKLQFHLDNQAYDKKYQDIELINFIGYSKSYKTWETIGNLVDWRNKKVVDLGCFHGYFSFKIADQGGKVLGLDNHEGALKTARLINQISQGKVKFKKWEGGQGIPASDVALCLNVLHHFKDPELALLKLKAKQVIFEINIKQEPLVKKYFQILKRIYSHRKKRVIFLAQLSK